MRCEWDPTNDRPAVMHASTACPESRGDAHRRAQPAAGVSGMLAPTAFRAGSEQDEAREGGR